MTRNNKTFNILFGILTYSGICMSIGLPLLDDIPGIPLRPACIVAMVLALLGSGMIFTRLRGEALRNADKKARNTYYYAALGGAVLMVAIYIFYSYAYNDTIFAPDWDRSDMMLFRDLYIKTFGIFLVWILLLNLFMPNDKQNLRTSLVTFLREHVSVYLIFRLIILVLTLLAALLMSGKNSGIQSSFFQYVLDDSSVEEAATGFQSGKSSFLSGFTAASSFFILSTFATEMLNGKSGPTFKHRLRRMFLDSDSVKLLLLTFTCVIISVLRSGRKLSVLEFLLTSILSVIWLVSLLMFLVNTKALSYIVHSLTLGLVEGIVAIPEIPGFGGFVVTLLLTLGRIVLFAIIAWMISYFALRAKAKNEGKQNSLYLKAISVTFLDVAVFLARISDLGLRGLIKNSKEESESELCVKFVVGLAKKADESFEKLLKPIQDRFDPDKKTNT